MITTMVIARRTRCVALAIVILTPGLVGVSAAQNPGTLSGVVFNASGALIPDAQVGVSGTNAFRSVAVSNAKGECRLPIPPGEYTIEVSATGFDNSKPAVVNIVAGHTLTHNVQLEIAVVKEQVRVSDCRDSGYRTDQQRQCDCLEGFKFRQPIGRSGRSDGRPERVGRACGRARSAS